MIWKIILGVLVVIGGLMALGAYKKNDPEWMEMQRAKTAIELCRKDAKQHAGNPSALSIIIPTCEKFEKEYRDKYRSNP